MPSSANDPGGPDALRATAADWYIRMHGPDAERDRVAFEAWLAASVEHRRVYDRMALRWDQSGLLGHTPSGQARSGLPPRRSHGRGRPWLYALAAGIALVLGVTLLLQLRGPATAPVGASSAIASEIGIRRVRLSDGSVVTLDADTRLSVRFSSGERRIALERGRARFEVAHNAQRPFIVSAAGREVVATGTVFDVSLSDAKVAVVLLRGGVDVRAVSREAPPALIARLRPGQSVELAPQRKPVLRTPSPAMLEWPSGVLEFDATPLRDVLAAANRYAPRQIRLGDSALGSLQVTGSFRVGDPDKLAAVVAAAFGLKVVASGDALVLTRLS